MVSLNPVLGTTRDTVYSWIIPAPSHFPGTDGCEQKLLVKADGFAEGGHKSENAGLSDSQQTLSKTLPNTPNFSHSPTPPPHRMKSRCACEEEAIGHLDDLLFNTRCTTKHALRGNECTLIQCVEVFRSDRHRRVTSTLEMANLLAHGSTRTTKGRHHPETKIINASSQAQLQYTPKIQIPKIFGMGQQHTLDNIWSTDAN